MSDRIHALITALPRPLARLGFWSAHRLLRVWWAWRRPAITGVAVAIRQGDRMLVVRHSYQPGLGLPGGAVDPGEGLEAAAARELVEELGIAVPAEALRHAGAWRYVEYAKDTTCHVYEWWPPALPVPAVDGREIVWAGYVPVAGLSGQRLVEGLRRYLQDEGGRS